MLVAISKFYRTVEASGDHARLRRERFEDGEVYWQRFIAQRAPGAAFVGRARCRLRFQMSLPCNGPRLCASRARGN